MIVPDLCTSHRSALASCRCCEYVCVLAGMWTLRQEQRLSPKTASAPTEQEGDRCAPTSLADLNLGLTSVLPSSCS